MELRSRRLSRYSVGCGWPVRRGNESLLTSPDRKSWVSKYGGQAVTHAKDPLPPLPLSTSLQWSIGKVSADTHGSSTVAGVARTLRYTASDCLRDSGSRFFFRVDSRSLSYEWYCRKAAQVWNQSFLSLSWAAFPDWWAPSTTSTGFQAPGNLSSPLLLSVVAVLPGLYLSHTSRLRAELSCQRLVETRAMGGILLTMGACPHCHPRLC